MNSIAVNKGKVWPDLGLLNRREEKISEEDRALASRITDRIFSEEEIRDLIRSEIPRIREEVNEGMTDFTVQLISEFEVAMVDCVEQVVANAAATVAKANKRAAPLPAMTSGYKSNAAGIIIPD